MAERRSPFKSKDGRRRHNHYQAIVTYRDNETFARVYTDKIKAEKFALRQKKSPLVKTVAIVKLS